MSPPTAEQALPGRLPKYLGILLELSLVAAVVYLFEIEHRRHFFPLLCLIIGGFAVHAWLPMKLRFAAFSLLSLTAVLFVLGLANGLWVLGLGGVLIGICLLPIGSWPRVILLLFATGLLMYFRARDPMPFWPVLGSMFMFRLMIYVYETRHESVRRPLAETLGYFYMLPNVCFPLFPVVDLRVFRRCWYDGDEWEIYQRGVKWIVRGILHLLLYRYIKSHLVPEPYELDDVKNVALFMATNYALYLQVSGQFHLVTGLLHLFGFRLPRTHHLYFLASSFSDIWRRINIYWKDFLSKLVFFPSFYAARGRGASLGQSTVLGVACVFVATWLLHSWQTFWIWGNFPIDPKDALLWLSAGACVAVNALFEQRRQDEPARPAWVRALILSLKRMGMFALVALFWACWTTPKFLDTLGYALTRPNAASGLLVVALWMAAIVIILTVATLLYERRSATEQPQAVLSFRESVQLHLAGLGIVVAFASPWGVRLLTDETANTLAELRTETTRQDEAARLQGYYEDLNSASIQAGPLIESFAPADEAQRAQAAGFYKVSRKADAYQEIDLIPGVRTELDEQPFSVNAFGMRDRGDLTLAKPDGTIRIALVGSSIVMGYGVSDEDVFSRRLENSLKAERPVGDTQIQVLNFGVGKQWAPQRLVRIQRKVFRFDPDALFYVAHQDEFNQLADHAAQLIAKGKELPSAHLTEVVRQAGITPEMAWGAIEARLHRHDEQLLAANYRTIVDLCREHQTIPVYVYLPMPGGTEADPKTRLLPIAQSAGFIVCDLTGWEGDEPLSHLYNPGETEHPTALGHQLIAEALVRMIDLRPEVLPAGGT